jgi:hypothetical protein
MDDKTKDLIRRLDDGTRLIKGEWTSDGRKLFRFSVTEIISRNVCALDVHEEKLESGIQYCLTGKGDPPVLIWIYRLSDNRELKAHRKTSGIGSFTLPMAGADNDEIQKGYIQIYLDPISFENFVQSINSLLFKGTIKFEVMVKETIGEESGDDFIVTEYLMENSLSLKTES